MSEPYKPRADWFAVQGEKYLGRSYSEMDCQGLVEQMLQDVGVNKDWKGSNAMWRDMAWTGTPEEAKKRFGGTPVGAFLFILAQDGGEVARGYKDGLGNASHVGVCTGKGKGAIHSSASKGKVAESAYTGKTVPNGGWNRVGLCKLLDYGVKVEAETGGKSEVRKVEQKYVSLGAGKAGTVNVRKGPGKSNVVIDKVQAGEMVLAEDLGNGWSGVETANGHRGYMMTEYLSDTNPGVSRGPDGELLDIMLTDEVGLSLTRGQARRLLTRLQEIV